MDGDAAFEAIRGRHKSDPNVSHCSGIRHQTAKFGRQTRVPGRESYRFRVESVGEMLFDLGLFLIIAVIVVIALHDYFSGRYFILDIIDEFRIARADIMALDRQCRANPNRSDVIVCLTSLPSRLPLIDDALKSLLRQTRAPAEIRLYLPAFSKREQQGYVVPDYLRRLKSVVIFDNEADRGPATKFMSAISSVGADQKLLIVDDDRIFPPDMLELLDDAATANPEAAYCIGGWIAPPDLVDRPTTMMMNINSIPPAQVRPARIRKATPIDILMGAHGFIVRPRHVDLRRLLDYSNAPEAAFFADDIWLSGYCRAPKYALPVERADFQPYRHISHYDNSSLGWVNRTGTPEQWVNTEVLKWFGPEPWRVGMRLARSAPRPIAGYRGEPLPD